MNAPVFEYGPVARGAYIMLLWLTLLVALKAGLGGNAIWLLAYVALLIFLGVFLRGFLVWSGIYSLYQKHLCHQHDAYNERVGGRASREIERREQALRYKRSRIKSPELPKHW